MKTVKFTQMKDGDYEDYHYLEKLESDYASQTGERLIAALAALEHSLSGYQVSRLEHSLQSATRAYYDGADDDWVVSTLLHDIGDVYAPYNHAAYAAAILEPYVREQCTRVVAMHAKFQMAYYAQHFDLDVNARQHYQGDLYFDDCDYFCEHWDQASFDPNYPSLPLSFFEPLVLKVFARQAFDPAHTKPATRQPMHDSKYSALRQRSI